MLAAAVPAVRLAADPQRRHPRRQPRHRLPDRRRPACTARPGRDRRPRRRNGRAGGPAGGVLHRLPAQRARAGRADPGGPDPATARADRGVPQDRQAAVRRHLQRGRRLRARRRGRPREPGTHRPRRGRRDAGPGAGDRGGARPASRGARRRSGVRQWCWPRRAPRSTTTGPARRTARRCWVRHCASCTPRPHRRCRHERPVRAARQPGRRAGRAARERGPARHGHAPCTPTTWPCAPGTSCTPIPSRRRTPTRASPRCGPSRHYGVPGVVRVLTAADVPGVNDAGVKHDEPLFPDEVMFHGHAVCWVLAETAGGRAAGRGRRRGRLRAAARAGHDRRGDRGAELPGRPAAHGARRRRSRPGRRGARVQRRARASPGRSTSTSRPTARWRRSTRPGRSSCSPARSTRRRPRRSSPTSSACRATR